MREYTGEGVESGSVVRDERSKEGKRMSIASNEVFRITRKDIH